VTKAQLTDIIMNSGDFIEADRKKIGRKNKPELLQIAESLKENQKDLATEIVELGQLNPKITHSLAIKPKKELQHTLKTLNSAQVFVNIEPLLIPNSI
jgi:hypothetical protein